MNRITMALACWIATTGSVLAVDGVIEINQTSALAGSITAGDAAGFPVEINTAGSYRLTSDLDVPGLVNGIQIDIDDVTLDLNGFSVFSGGEVGNNNGILVFGGNENVEIRNGTVRNFFHDGIVAGTQTQLRVIDVRSIENLQNGIVLEGVDNLVERCTMSNNGINGLQFFLGIGSLVSNSIARNNGQEGFRMGSGAYRSNVLTENNGGNANPQVTLGIQIGPNLCGTNLVCP